MKITDVKTWVVGNPPPGIGGKYFIFVKLTTDGGVVGYGEAYNATFSGHVTAKMIEDMAERYLVGRDPHDIENFFRRAYSSGFTQRPDVSGMGCFSALEMACWDIIGKEANKPVYKLLGGQVHETLRSYTYLYPHTGSVHSEDARRQERLQRPRPGRRLRARICRAGLQCGQARPGRPLHRLRRPPAAPRRHRSLRPHDQGDPRGGRHARRHPVRHARPVHRLGRAAAWRAPSNPTIPSGSRSRCRRTCPR